MFLYYINFNAKGGFKMKRKVIVALLVSLLIIGFCFTFSCQKKSAQSKIIVAMATDVGGLGDKSFNDGSYNGLLKAKEQFGVEVKVVESKQATDYVPNLSNFAKENAKIVFAVGFLMQDAMMEAAKNNPNTYYAGVDIGVDPATAPSNVLGILFKEQEAGYLAGIVAGLLTSKYSDALPGLNKDNKVGIVLGMDIPPVERYQAGFYAGVKAVNPACEVITIVTNVFNDPAKGKEAALALYEKGCDIVFHIAGLTGNGVFDAAKEKGKYAFGVDVDQNYLNPDVIITSAEKKLTEATFLVVKSVLDGTFKGGTNVTYGLKEGGVGISDFHNFNDKIPQEIKDAIAKAIEDINNGVIIAPATRVEAGYQM